MTAQLDADFVGSLIGMRVNKWWKFWKYSIYNDIPVWGLLPGSPGACRRSAQERQGRLRQTDGTELVVRF
jgi:hypothetical protein